MDVKINSHLVRMMLDIGASISCIGQELWKKLSMPPLKPIVKKKKLPVLVTVNDDEPIFGLNWIQELDIDISINALTVQQEDSLFKSIFNDIVNNSSIFEKSNNAITNYTASIILNPDAKPIIFKPRKVPYALKNKVEEEIQRLVKDGILEKINDVTAPLKWASHTVNILKPNGKVRICGDFMISLKKYINYLTYPLPTFADILDKINGAKYYSIIDLKDAYLQMPLDKKSSDVTVISTHIGFDRHKRMRFGISAAAAIFQRLMDTIFNGMKHTTFYLDDIIVTGTNSEENLNNVAKVLSII
ncbi:Retrovirus-related Pol polyprotein [Thelohanellus kitauei]|uniref:Retrovirus-related Pol polyprotein n=1 Tax=Thelohanellus kitauei TaxID=669202 RepID=A0A0C2J5J2_THEKT|nr:Retrovirus-related Pol polyprotein [Thelohanellus kitauei]